MFIYLYAHVSFVTIFKLALEGSQLSFYYSHFIYKSMKLRKKECPKRYAKTMFSNKKMLLSAFFDYFSMENKLNKI